MTAEYGLRSAECRRERASEELAAAVAATPRRRRVNAVPRRVRAHVRSSVVGAGDETTSSPICGRASPPWSGLRPGAIVLFAWLLAVSALAVEIVPSGEPQQVSAADARVVEVRLRNPAAEPAQLEVRFQLLQLTASTAAPVGSPRAWKPLTLLPGQTVVERVTIEFPAVRITTRFAVRWLDATGKLLGVTELWAHPDNLLDTLKLLAGGQPIGLTDEIGRLRPGLAARGISIRELSDAKSWQNFRGRLALVVSKPESSDEPRLPATALARAKDGLAVVWFRPPQPTSPPASPLAERVTLGRGAVVLAAASVLDGLDRSPTAQLALLRLAELALSSPTQVLAHEP